MFRATSPTGRQLPLLRSWSCLLLLLILFFVLSAGACEVERNPDRNSGEDHLRTKAKQMPLNRVIIDHVDVLNGDQTDWKYFTLNSPGIVKIIVNFDNEEAEAQIEVINAVGLVMSDLELPESTDLLRQLSFKAQPGNYYLHVWAQELQTDYSVEVKFEEMSL